MPTIEEQKTESSAEILAETLRMINFKDEQERLKRMEIMKAEEQKNKLLGILESHRFELENAQLEIKKGQNELNKIKLLFNSRESLQEQKFREIFQYIANLNNRSIEQINKLENSLKKEFVDIKVFKKFTGILQESIENIKSDYNKQIIVLEKNYKITTEEIVNKFKANYDREIALIEGEYNQKSESFVKNIQGILGKLKIDYRDLLNKPDILTENETNKLIVNYSKKIEELFQIDLKLFQTKIEGLKKDYKSIVKSTNNLGKNFSLLKEENKKLNTKVNLISYYPSYSHDGGYDYATVRMTKMTFITSNYPASSVDFGIMANAISGNITVTLPPALKTGQVLSIKKIDSSTNTVTIIPSGSETIEGSSSIILSLQYESKWVVSGGNSIWYVVSSTGAAGIGTETPSGTQNGVNITFTVSHIPAFLTFNGQMLYENNGYSRSNLTLTLDLAPSATDILKSHY